MSASAKLPPWVSVGEFLQWDSGDDRRYQLVNGVPHAMAPTSNTHGLLQNELGRLIGNHLRERRSACEVITAPGVVPHLLSDHNFRIPDLAVTCAPVLPGPNTLSDPVLIVEILSPSNQAETWTNVWAYTTIPSIREILIVHSTAICADLLRRDAEGNWPERALTIDEGARRTAATEPRSSGPRRKRFATAERNALWASVSRPRGTSRLCKRILSFAAAAAMRWPTLCRAG